jgi:hypothetical protein
MATSDATPIRVDDRYARVRGKVMVQVGDNTRAAALASYADGVVLHGEAGYDAAREVTTVEAVLIDPERYTMDRGRRSIPPHSFESLEESAMRQLAAGATCLLAPSRFPDDRDAASLREVLAIGQEFVERAGAVDPTVPSLVPVVVRYDELANRTWSRLVHESGIPVATVFAGYADPLASRAQLEGAIDLVQQASVAIALRCDVSIAGLVALGAASGAIGASSAMRHLWLPSKRGRGGRADTMFIPAPANWMKTGFIRQAAADPDLDEIFRCTCIVCGPSGDVRALTGSEVAQEMRDRHSVAAAVKLVRRVVDADQPVDAWRESCRRAVAAYATLKRLGVTGPAEPGFLGAWLDVLG